MRLVASDIDGTILGHDGKISDRTVRAFHACRDAGLELVFVTGRPPRWLHPLQDQLGHTGTVICSNGAVVWDLLPNEHAAAIDWTELTPRRRVTVRFLDRSGRTVSHWNKLLKGSIVRWLLEGGFPDASDLADFDHPQGYRFDPAMSDLGADPAVVVLRELG